MERTIRKFRSFAEAERADREYYRSLTPQQRLDILLELVATYTEGLDEAERGFKRVCRVVKRQRR